MYNGDTETQIRLNQTGHLIEDHAEWYGIIVKRIFYPERYRAESVDTYAEAFRKWIVAMEKEDGVDRGSIDILDRLHAELIDAGGRISRESAHGHKAEEKAFEALQNLSGEILSRLLRTYQDLARTESGVDPASGLRNKKRMAAELMMEMDRRARRGNPFSVVLARIDNYALIRAMTTEEQKPIMARLGALILKCMRSFDDAYRCDDGEFVLSLKQSTTPGGTAAINRLRSMIDDANIMLADGKGGQEPLTMSYCVSEPLAGETIDTLFANMRADLNRYQAKGNTALEYFEQSALSRLIGAIDK